MLSTNDLRTTLKRRRDRLATQLDCPALLWSGCAPARNFPANRFPFRASSHFLYFAGIPLENAVILIEGGRLELFYDDPPAASILWHGETPSRAQLAAVMGADDARPLDALPACASTAATIPHADARTASQQQECLNRAADLSEPRDRALAEAIVALRLIHDETAIAAIRAAAAITVAAHKAGMAATVPTSTEATVRAAIEAVFLAHNATPAYNSIVTVCGEVLHSDRYENQLATGDLLLVDAGAETASGWASDVTRTWPVAGQFSSTQRDLYDVVLAAHDGAIAAVRPGVEYREVHLLAATILARGLVDLGILRGNAEDLVAQDAHALFFPHGIGHLLGLDVHDMEDLGDLAGYAAGRQRSDRFGFGYLRLDRPLNVGNIVTIEPGFYQVPALVPDRSPAR
ncbi:MAG: aminopeptidase P family protein, partial [Cyanobacteria bacterium J06641_5]